MQYRLTKGLDVRLDGAPEQRIDEARLRVATVALIADDFPGQRLTPLVKPGDRVRLAQTLAVDRDRPEIRHGSPGAGVVREVVRGERRRLNSVVVELGGEDEEHFESTPSAGLAGLAAQEVTRRLVASGLWTALRTRPFDRVPAPGTAPRSIFVTAMDSSPLAPLAETVLAEDAGAFADGLQVLACLTAGPVFVCCVPGAGIPGDGVERVRVVEFAGRHPAGLVGTHVDRLDPVGGGRTVWHLGYQDVLAIGKLFTTGRVPVERVISLAGPMVRRPRLVRTRIGANTDDLVRGELRAGECRIVSGSPLSGRQASGWGRFLGRYHTQVCVLEEEVSGERRWWRRSGRGTTALHGRPTVFYPTGDFERVVPLDLLVAPLLRALLTGDTEKARALGCLGLVEEDLALCTYVCPGKLEYGAYLRAALERIEKGE